MAGEVNTTGIELAPTVNPQNPLDTQNNSVSGGSNLISGIVSTETGTGEERILESAPEIDMTLLKDIAPPKSILLYGLKITFFTLAGLSVAAVLFFTSQLTSAFNLLTNQIGLPNALNQIESVNAEVTNLQTDLNFYRYLQIKGYLDQFSFYGDSFMQNFEVANSQTADEQEKEEAREEIEIAKGYLKESFLEAKARLIIPFEAPLYSKEGDADIFQNKLTMKLQEKAAEAKAGTDEKAVIEEKNYLHTVNLVGNSELNQIISTTDFDALTDQEIYDLIKKINGLVVNDLSTIQGLKDGRIRWSDLMNEIELRTIAVDKYYNEDSYELLGGIRYTSYDLDKETQSITIAGETKRIDTKTFTMIADLIDKLNASSFFEKAESKSFSKSGSLDKGYTASIKLTLGLQKEAAAEDDKTDVETFPNL